MVPSAIHELSYNFYIRVCVYMCGRECVYLFMHVFVCVYMSVYACVYACVFVYERVHREGEQTCVYEVSNFFSKFPLPFCPYSLRK